MHFTFSALHPSGQRSASATSRLHVSPEEQSGARTQAVVLLVAADVALPGRREHGGAGGARTDRALALFAQPRTAQRAPLCRWPVRGTHPAPERAPRPRAAGSASPTLATPARVGSLRGHGARQRHRLRQRQRRRLQLLSWCRLADVPRLLAGTAGLDPHAPASSQTQKRRDRRQHGHAHARR